MKDMMDAQDRLSKRWAAYERSVLIPEVTSGKKERAMGAAYKAMPLETKLEWEMIRKDVRERFLHYELRARRQRVLPKLKLWEQENKAWRESMREWQIQRAACRTLGNELHLESPAFSWPPLMPMYSPNQDELVEMYERCRKFKGKGWLEAPTTAPVNKEPPQRETHSRQERRRRRATPVKEERPVEENPWVDEDLYGLGIPPSERPHPRQRHRDRPGDGHVGPACLSR